ncbi:hypothetical protein PHISP_08206 [Aspergillus sp. HF37]|nr:hypothetical protein PHISP_08206 [Aspergillus sp. HF37]
MRCEHTLEGEEKAIQPGEVGGEQEGAKKAIEQVTQPGKVGDNDVPIGQCPPQATGSRTVAS